MITDTVRRAQEGDHAAFAELYGRYYRSVLRICAKITREPGGAEDLTQDTFLRAFTHLRSFRGNAQFGTWLCSIARNTALMKVRKKNYASVELDAPSDSLKDNIILATRDLALEGIADREVLACAMANLPKRMRRVFILRAVEGRDTVETAEYLGTAIGTIKANFSRAKSSLRRQLSR